MKPAYHKKLTLFFTVMVVMLCVMENTHAAVTITASSQQKTIRVGETAQIYVEITSDGGETFQQPQFPVIEGLSFAFSHQSSNQTSVQIINGRMKSMSSQGLVYIVQAGKEGNYTIEPVQISVGNTTVRANPIPLSVLAAPPTPQPQAGSQSGSKIQLQATSNGDGIILLPEINKNTVFVGEEIQLTFTAFFPVSVSRISLDDKRGQFQKFWTETFEMLDSNNQEELIIQNTRYLKVPIRRYFLYPLTAGEHTIEPLTLTCEVRVGGRLGFFAQGRESVVTSSPITVKVNPLPQEGKPDIFDGAVGQFSLNSHVEETSVNEGSTITLSVSLSGYGNIRNAPPPVLPDLSKFDTFDPTKDESISVQADGIAGTVKYTHVLLPHDTNANKIGPVRFAYFDPQNLEYVTLHTEPVELIVFPSQRNGTRMSTSGANRRIITRTGEDFRYIAVTPAALATVYLPLFRSAGYWFILMLPLALMITVWFYQRHLDFLMQHPDLVRRSNAPKRAEKLLAEARKAVEEQNGLQTYAALSKAVNDYISNRWNIASAGLTGDELKMILLKQSIPETTSDSVLELLQSCDAARFSGGAMESSLLRQDYEKAKQIMSELFKVKS